MVQTHPPHAGVALVLLPGMDGTGELLQDFAAAWGPGAQVIAYPVDVPLSYEQLDAWVRERLPRDRDFVVLGESFSGPLAIRLAAQPPQGLVGLVLCSTFATCPRAVLAWMGPWAARWPAQWLPGWGPAWAVLGGVGGSGWRPRLMAALRAVAPAVLRSRAHSVATVNVLPQLAQVRVPVLYLRALGDRVVPPAAGAQILQALPQATLVELAGPHCLLQVQARAALQAVQAFVTALPVRASTSASPSPEA